MKILELGPYILIQGHKHGMKNQTGFAYMFRDIVDMLADQHEVYVMTQSILTDEMHVGKWVLLKRSIFTIFRNFCWGYFVTALKFGNKFGMNFKQRLKIIFYFLSAGQVEAVIKTYRPDIIHIHSIDIYTLPYFMAAAKYDIPVICTLHGLVSFNNMISDKMHKRIEHAYLQMVIENGYDVSLVSSGMLDRITSRYGINKIRVILNYLSIPDNYLINKLFYVKKDAVKTIVCVGSLAYRKNQIQLLRVLPVIQKYFANKYEIQVNLIGDGEDWDLLHSYVDKNKLSGVIFNGRMQKSDVYSNIEASDLLVLPSIDEGFGLPIIEAYHAGIPVVTFNDIDAINDLYSEDCMIVAGDHKDETLAKAIIESLDRQWDKDSIKKFSKKFSAEIISKQYEEYIQNATKAIDKRDIDKFINKILS
jgi:glycosyltransferase involved in cell wall biosynthesis